MVSSQLAFPPAVAAAAVVAAAAAVETPGRLSPAGAASVAAPPAAVPLPAYACTPGGREEERGWGVSDERQTRFESRIQKSCKTELKRAQIS